MLPYGHLYRAHTRGPIISIIEEDDELEVRAKLIRWFHLKLREAQYVQVAVREWRIRLLFQDFTHPRYREPFSSLRSHPAYPGMTSPLDTGPVPRYGMQV